MKTTETEAVADFVSRVSRWKGQFWYGEEGDSPNPTGCTEAAVVVTRDPIDDFVASLGNPDSVREDLVIWHKARISGRPGRHTFFARRYGDHTLTFIGPVIPLKSAGTAAGR